MYSVQSLVPGKHEWKVISSSRAGHQVFDNITSAFKTLRSNMDLARCIFPMRVGDEEGVVYYEYDPEQDMRLPGPRFRETSRRAYFLWERAGKPACNGEEFWYQAETELPDENGLKVSPVALLYGADLLV